jgi:Protein of unknown function (DUF3047)
LLAALLLAACAGVPATAPSASPGRMFATPASAEPIARGPDPTPFSTAVALDVLPAGWRPFRLARLKKPTEYRLVPFEGSVAMRAVAESSASGLRFDTAAEVHEYPWLAWKWKVTDLIQEANNSLAHVEDSPARVVVLFEGGRDQLPPGEQINYDLAKAMGGNELPYATLMYIWENHLPEGEIITHHFTTRIKMIVAGSGRKDVGEWHEERVNLLEDFRRAFGEEPPRVKAVGIMTDSDNTGTRAEAYYGDIRFLRR